MSLRPRAFDRVLVTALASALLWSALPGLGTSLALRATADAMQIIPGGTAHSPSTNFVDGVGTITRIDLGPKGTPGYNIAGPAGMTADGRTVFFNSSNLFYTTQDGIQLGTGIPWARDQASGVTKPLAPQTYFPNSLPDILGQSFSSEGRYIAFDSTDSTLVTGDTNGVSDVFVKDTTTGTITRMSVSSSGTQANGASYFPHISADGRYVAFQSDATNLVKTDRNGVRDIFLRDRTLNTTIMVSVSSSGRQGDQQSGLGNSSNDTAISSDGRYVAYVSYATTLVTGDTNVKRDIFLYDRTTAVTTRVSIGTGGTQSNGNSDAVAMSGDGRYVAFQSQATNFSGGGTNGFNNIYVRDTTAATTTRVSKRTSGAQTTSESNCPAFSSDGHYVGFTTADPLFASDTNGFNDVYVSDATGGSLSRVSIGNAGEQGNSSSNCPILSQDGRYVAFISAATNFAPGTPNGGGFVYDRLGADFGATYPFTFGGDEKDCKFSCAPTKPGTGSYTTQATDFTLPGRILSVSFTRTYNSDDKAGGPFGYAWSHNYHWRLRDYGTSVEIRGGDGSRDVYTQNPDGSYADPPDVFATLVKNGDGSFTLTQKGQRMFEFGSDGLLSRIHEPAGNQITLAYTGALLTTITDPVGHQLTFTYNPDNTISQIQDSSGRKVTYTYDTTGRLITVTDKIGNTTGQDPNLHRWTYGYDGTTHRLTTITDPDGRVRISNTYDTSGRVIQQRDALQKLTTFAYTTNQTVITDPRLVQITENFDGRTRTLNRSEVVNGTTLSQSVTYDTSGNVTASVDRNGKETDFTYDTHGNLKTRTDPQIDPQTPRYITSYDYDTKNNLIQITDAKGFLANYTYDPTLNVRLSLTNQIDATTSAVTKYEYGDPANPGLPTRVIAPRGNTGPTPNYTFSTSLSYDSGGDLIQQIDADGAKTTYGYDSIGRRTSIVDPEGYAPGGVPADHTWTTAYNPNDMITTDTDPLGHSVSYTYDGAGDRKTTTDRNGNVTTYIYDGAARLQKVQQKPDPVGQPTLVYETVITRDDNGNTTRVVQANGVQTDYSYDALNRLSSSTSHPTTGASLVTQLTLDGNGNVVTRHTADGVDTTYTYDSLNRLTQVTATGLAPISYGYDELSRRTSMIDGTGTTSYSYDRMDRLTAATQPNGSLSWGYDLDSNRTGITYPDALAVTYGYSNADRLSTVTDSASRQTTYTYTAAGLAHTVTLPNNMVTTYSYDRAQRLSSLTNVLGPTTITSHTYTLDNEGNRTALTEFVSGITTGASDTFGLTYDGLERLTAVTTTSPETFSLDGASNLTARTGPSATFTIDGANRPTSDGTNTLTWSNADRLTGRGSDTFGYDALDRLTTSTVAGTTRTYAYNGDGLMQSQTQGVTTTHFLWDTASNPARLLVDGSTDVVYGLGPLYSVNGSTVTTFARDGQKSIRAELNGSTVTGSWRYLAYGAITQSSGAATPTVLGYTGQLLDPSGLYYLRARWYDPASARFLTRDPMSGSNTSPETLNAFAYAGGRPSAAYDPAGLFAESSDTADGGACVYIGCHTYRDYNPITYTTAAETPMILGGGTTQLEEQTYADGAGRSDYTYLAFGIGKYVSLQFTIDRYDRLYVGMAGGLSASPPITASLMEGYIRGRGSDYHSREAVEAFVGGLTRNETAGAIFGYGHTASLGDRDADEIGIVTPQLSASGSFAWTGQDLAQRLQDWFFGR